MPRPARSTGTTTTSAPIRAARRGTERRLDRHVARRQIAQRFGRQQHADARRRAAEMFGSVVLSRSDTSASCTERVIDEVNRHGCNYTTLVAGG